MLFEPASKPTSITKPALPLHAAAGTGNGRRETSPKFLTPT